MSTIIKEMKQDADVAKEAGLHHHPGYDQCVHLFFF
jgi:hypothetical protein